jgi:hypothetical protein
MLGLGDQNLAWQVIVMIEQNMSFNAAFDGFELGPWKQAQTQRNRRGVQRQQLIFESKATLAAAQRLSTAKSVQCCPEKIFKQRSRPFFIGIRQRGFIRGTFNTQMNEFAEAATEAITDLAKRSRMGQLTKQHRHKLCPARKSLRTSLCLVFSNQRIEFVSGEMLQQLIEQTRYSYHGSALLGKVGPHRFGQEVTMHRQV